MGFDHSLWGLVVPDGSRFCHWGGKSLSKKLAARLKLQKTDLILDLCCGEGGLTDYLPDAGLVVGIDISQEAVSRAQLSAKHPNVHFTQADARKLPFGANTFNKVLAQDADVWMQADKHALMREVARVMKPSGVFLWQSYMTREQHLSSKTVDLLQRLGYSSHNMPRESEIPDMFTKNGFTVKNIESLHCTYAADNIRMLSRARKLNKESYENLLQLLEWERSLFEDDVWTGILVSAKRRSD